MEKIKKIIPPNVRKIILQMMDYGSVCLAWPFSKLGVLSSLFYFVFSRKFDREHKAVLKGRIAYWRSLEDIQDSAALLRRNIHRLEKGLIMSPRRPIFADKYIEETVEIFRRALAKGSIDEMEKKWAEDVLKRYFSVVKDSKNIFKAREIFSTLVHHSSNVNLEDNQFIPYFYKDMPASKTTYEDFYRLCKRRRSVRWYQDKPVPSELIEKAVNAASLAPSACNRQPYKFYVATDKEKAIEIGKCAGGTKGFAQNFPCVITVVGDLSCYPYEKDRHLIYIDGSLAAMQLMLSFDTLGLASCPINWPDVEPSEKKLSKILKLKPYERPIMLISVGYANPDGGIPFSQKKNARLLIKHV